MIFVINLIKFTPIFYKSIQLAIKTYVLNVKTQS